MVTKEEKENHSSISWVETKLLHQRKQDNLKPVIMHQLVNQGHTKESQQEAMLLNNHMVKLVEALALPKFNNMKIKSKNSN